MMGRSLLVIGLIGTLGLIAAAVVGYTLHGLTDVRMSLHAILGLFASVAVLFSHCWIMFYFIGTGKAIKDAVRENGLDLAIIEETKRFKNESYPWLMLAMGLVMAAFILGGGVATKTIPLWVHHVLFLAALIVQSWTLRIELRVLRENQRLMANVDRRLAAAVR
jgi:hypothetical protein